MANTSIDLIWLIYIFVLLFNKSDKHFSNSSSNIVLSEIKAIIKEKSWLINILYLSSLII